MGYLTAKEYGKKLKCLKNNKLVRNSNLELLRIIAMFLIVAHHYVVNSGLMDLITDNPMNTNSAFLLIYGAWGKTCINCFVLITGYFMCKSNITVRKFIKLLSEIMFYRIIIYLIFLCTGYEAFSIDSFLKAFIPITSIQTGFASCFLIFWLSIPFLNILIRNLDKKMHMYLIAICSFTYIFLGTAHRVTMNYVSWFIVLYFIASYIRIYSEPIFERKNFWGGVSLISILLSIVSIFACLKLGLSAYSFVSDPNTFLAVVTGLSSFLFFKNLKIPNSKVINTIAASTFGVLLIHASSDTMRQWLWKDTLDNTGAFNNSMPIVHALISVVSVFIICVIIDQIRIRILEKPFMKFVDKRIEGRKL